MPIHPALESNLRVMAHDCRELLGIIEALDNDPGAMARIWGYTQQDTDRRIDQLIDEIKRLCHPTMTAMLGKWQEERIKDPTGAERKQNVQSDK